MPFQLTIGRPGMGKSMDTAKMVLWALERARHLDIKGVKMSKEYANKMLRRYPVENLEQLTYKKGKVFGLVRKVALNFHLSSEVELKFKKYILYWQDPMDLIKLTDYDLFIDEIANYFPSDKWKDTHYEVRRMFAQHRKRGMEIFANTQDYRMVDINARRMLSSVYQLYKVIGSRSPSTTLPEIKHPWGVIAKYQLDPESLEDEKNKERVGWPDFFLITKKLTKLYDTTEDIKPAPAPQFHHVERTCATCKFTKAFHT